MPTGFQINDQSAVYYLTFQVVHWADIFTRRTYRDIVIESLAYCRKNKGLEIFSFVIMSNHIHIVVRSKTGLLSETIRDFKRHTSKQIINTIQTSNESRKEWLLMIFRYAARKPRLCAIASRSKQRVLTSNTSQRWGVLCFGVKAILTILKSVLNTYFCF